MPSAAKAMQTRDAQRNEPSQARSLRHAATARHQRRSKKVVNPPQNPAMSKPSCRSRIRGLQQNADQQRSAALAVNVRPENPATCALEQPDGEHIADDASRRRLPGAHGEKFTNHNLNMYYFTDANLSKKMITNRSIICRNKWNFCHIWRRGLLAPAVRAMRRRFPSARGVGGCIGARRLRFSRAGRSRERGGMPRKRRAAA